MNRLFWFRNHKFISGSVMFTVLLHLVLILAATTFGAVYKPCEFVEALNKLNHEETDHIPLITCIAGYRNYNTSYRLVTGPNHTGYYGIFGLHINDVNSTRCLGREWDVASLLDDDIADDFYCMKDIILDHQINKRFYEKICSSGKVQKVTCAITNYAIAGVWDPIDKNLTKVVWDPIDKNLTKKAFETVSPARAFLPTVPSSPPTITEPDIGQPLLYAALALVLITLVLSTGFFILKRRAKLLEAAGELIIERIWKKNKK